MPSGPPFRAAYERAAKGLGISTQLVEVSTADEIERAFSATAQDGFDGLVLAGPFLFNERVRIGASALELKIPTLSGVAEMVPYGLLLSYGQNFPDFFGRAVGYADKILKGAKPADMPVEQPTRFKLVINRKTAKALGLTIPPSPLITADEVVD